MALAVIIGGALLSGVSGALALAGSAQRKAGASVVLLKTDDRLRAAVGQVRIPYWQRSAKIERDGNDLVIPWFQGMKDRTLRVGLRDDRLFMMADDVVTRFERIENADIRVLSTNGAMPVGLEIAYTLEDRDVRIVAPFGAHPLGAPAK